MAGDEIGLRNQIAGVNRLRTEAQMRNRHRARFLGVVNEVALRVVVGVLADDLDGILVGAHRAVRAQAVEHRADHAVWLNGEFRIVIQAGVADVVIDADREMILRLSLVRGCRIPPSPWRV